MDKVYGYKPDEEPTAVEISDDVEAQIRAAEDAGILRQVNALAVSDIESELNRAEANSERRREEAQERYIRDDQDSGLQTQINKLAEANMRTLLKEHETHKRRN